MNLRLERRLRVAADLEARYTASQLAMELARATEQLRATREAERHFASALHEIARGGWTAEGAQQIANETLNAPLSTEKP